jgi:hypothetical protein
MRVAVHHNKHVVRGDAYLTLVVTWNALYSLFIFFIAAWVQYSKKVQESPGHELSDLDRAWYTACLAVWTATEPFRLYLGVRGNRIMSVSHLVGFLILTFAAHMPIMVLFNAVIPFADSLDYSTSLCQLIFGAAELLLGASMLRQLVRRNTVDFFVHLGSLDAAYRYNDADETSNASSDDGKGDHQNEALLD